MDDQMKRLLLFSLLAIPLIFLFQAQQQAKTKKAQEERQRIERERGPIPPGPAGPSFGATTRTLTAAPGETPPSRPIAEPVQPALGENIVVKTNTYEVTFTTAGAFPTEWKIIDREFAKVVQSDIDEDLAANREPRKMGSLLPYDVIPQYEGISEHRDYPLMVALKEKGGPWHNYLNRSLYQVKGPKRVSFNGSEEIEVVFTSKETPEGLRLTKTFRFPTDGYLVRLEIRVENASSAQGGQNLAFTEDSRPGLGLLWGPGIGKAHYKERWDGSLYKVVVHNGEEILSDKFGKWAAAGLDNPIETNWRGGKDQGWKWAMLDSRFYAAAIIPDEKSPLVRGVVKSQHVPYAKEHQERMAVPTTIEMYSEPFRLGPGESRTFEYSLFVGPKKRSLLAEIDEKHHYNIRRIMFQSDWWISDNVIRPLAVFMLFLLGWFHDLTGSYGIAIILVVLVMRLLTQPFTHLGMKSQARVMAEQKRIKPLIDAINEKYKDDPQKKSAETWKTYKEHGVNPLGMLKGCGWMLVQMPIFFALYRLLMGAIDLRGEGFLWIADLTAPDALFLLPFNIPWLGNKFNILPILMGLSQLLAQRLQSSNIEDPMQKQMMYMMPIMFIFMLYNFAAGLSLYWFVSNIWQIVFQIFINKKVREEAEKKAHKAFDDRQKAIQSGTFQKKKPAKPSWRDRMMAALEKKAKEAETQKKKTQPRKKKK